MKSQQERETNEVEETLIVQRENHGRNDTKMEGIMRTKERKI